MRSVLEFCLGRGLERSRDALLSCIHGWVPVGDTLKDERVQHVRKSWETPSTQVMHSGDSGRVGTARVFRTTNAARMSLGRNLQLKNTEVVSRLLSVQGRAHSWRSTSDRCPRGHLPRLHKAHSISRMQNNHFCIRGEFNTTLCCLVILGCSINLGQ